MESPGPEKLSMWTLPFQLYTLHPTPHPPIEISEIFIERKK